MSSKKPRGFLREISVHPGHPKRVFTEPKVRSQPEDAVHFAREAIREAKQAVMGANRHARGRHLSIDGGMRRLKNELRDLRNGKRRK